MKDLLNVLGKIHPLSKPFRQYLSDHLKLQTLAPKEFLLKAGAIGRRLYFIEKGLVRCYYFDNGLEICSKFLKENDIIVSASSFFLQEESREYIQTIEPTTVYSLTYDELQYIYRYYIESNIISRVLSTKSYLLSEQRSFFIRMRQAADRYKTMMEHHPELINRVPVKYMASYLGMTEETLSRIRAGSY
jgi:CRP-like cAMP-binding protein